MRQCHRMTGSTDAAMAASTMESAVVGMPVPTTLSGRMVRIADDEAANEAAACVTMKLTRKPAPVKVITHSSSTSGIMMGQARHSNVAPALPVPMLKHSQAKWSHPVARKM